MLRIIYYVLAVLALLYGPFWLGVAMLAIPLAIRLAVYGTVMRLLGIV